MWNDFWKCINLPPELQDSAHANFIAWERLRLYFNGALVAVTVVIGLIAGCFGLMANTVTMEDGYRIVALGTAGVFGAIPVNIAFCVGPVVEGYLVRWRMDRAAVRTLLFFAGLVIGAGMAGITAAAIMFTPDFAD